MQPLHIAQNTEVKVSWSAGGVHGWKSNVSKELQCLMEGVVCTNQQTPTACTLAAQLVTCIQPATGRMCCRL